MSEEEKDRLVIIGTEKSPLYPGDVIPGSKLTTCSGCPVELTLAPSSQAILAIKPNAIVLCSACLKKEMIKDEPEDITTLGIARGGIEELKAAADRAKKFRDN